MKRLPGKPRPAPLPTGDGWKFYQHANGGWSWRLLGINACDSSGQFTGIVEAMADAVIHGFTPGASHVDEITLYPRLLLR